MKSGSNLRRDAEFFDGPVPVVPVGIGMAEVIMRPGFVRGFLNRVGPEREPIAIKLLR